MLASLSSWVNPATDSRLTSAISGRVWSRGWLHDPCLPHTSPFRHGCLIVFSHLPLSLASCPNFAFEEQPYQGSPFFPRHTEKNKYSKSLRSWHLSLQSVSNKLSGAATRAPVPGNHLPSNRVPDGQLALLWSSSRALVSRACLLLLGLINITSFSVCLSEIIDYCSSTVEWQRVLMNFRKKSEKKTNLQWILLKRKNLKTSLSFAVWILISNYV